MSYSKIILDPKSKWPIIVEDLALAKLRPPLYTLYRFNIYKLKIIEKDFYDNENLIGFVLEGKTESERAIVFLTIVQPKKIIRYRIQKKISFDGETALLMCYALIVKLKNTEGYEYFHFGFPKIK